MRLTRNKTVNHAISAFNSVLDDLDAIAQRYEKAAEHHREQMTEHRHELGRARQIGSKIRELIGA